MTPSWLPELLVLAGNHLWQSTLVASAIALAALAFRRQHARVRYWLWFAASMKFLLPFAALVAIGNAVSWRTIEIVPFDNGVVLVDLVSEPFSQQVVAVRSGARAQQAASIWESLPVLAVAVWVVGFLAVLATWLVKWRTMRATASRAVRLESGREVAIMRRLAPRHGVQPVAIAVSDSPLEPGVFGIWRPLLLWPRGIGEHLTDAQVEAILAHELCHLRRHDNLAAALHMGVQALFWFHPLVWWTGARLVDERERACDEEVIRLGSEPEVYAESILKTCKFFLESPLPCVSGVTGSDLKKRIEQIMTSAPGSSLTAWRKALLAAAGVVAFVTPVAVGALNPPPQTRELAAPATLPAFEEVSIRPNVTPGPGGRGGQMQPGRYVGQNLTMRTVIRRAFARDGASPGSGLDLLEQQLAGGPEWVGTDKFDIVATTPGETAPPRMRLMLQRMLAERFEMTAHWESREMPVYLLTRLRPDGPLAAGMTRTTDEECAASRGMPMAPPAPGRPAQPPPCGSIQFAPGVLIARGAPMEWLAQTFVSVPVVSGIDRPVLDRTGLTGNFGFTIKFAPAQATNPDPDRPSLFTALEEQLGLKLESTRAPVEVLVIDRIEKPAAN